MATEFGEATPQAAWWPCLWQLRLAADWHVELWIFGSGDWVLNIDFLGTMSEAILSPGNSIVALFAQVTSYKSLLQWPFWLHRIRYFRFLGLTGEFASMGLRA